MPRAARRVVAGLYYHVLNRGNGRMRIFHKAADYDAFVQVLREALERYSVDLLAWCLMPNHWHLVLRPRRPDALAGFMRWVGVTHVRRHHQHYHSRGGGHLYQGRFKSFPIQDDRHFCTVCRYVESNPLRARLVKRAEAWRWSSLNAGQDPTRRLPIGEWPVARPRDWVEIVNQSLPPQQLNELRQSAQRGRPFGDEGWTMQIARKLGLTNTLRNPGRPPKHQRTEAQSRMKRPQAKREKNQ
ncbi:MAG: transposase [Phycisphaerae bacterium]|nr:transposase [Phycisphaerae bacterium]MDW8262146.1 transposase [Phycisphaerales bacterium]